MTRILVAGGAGFIGSSLTRRLVQLGFETIVVDAFREYATPTLPLDITIRRESLAGATVEKIDLLDYHSLAVCFRSYQPSVVVNLAANPIVSAADRDPQGCAADIVLSCRNLVHAALDTGSVRRLVHVSSSMVYGDFVEKSAVETSATLPVNRYGRLKLASEKLVRALGSCSQIETVIVRPMAVYGPGDPYTRVIPVFCTRALAGQQLTVRASADTLIDFSYVTDIAEGLALAALEPIAAGQIFNLSFGTARTLTDAVAALRHHMPHLRYEILPPTGQARPRRGALDISKARSMLGYQPRVSLEEGIARYLQFRQINPQPNRLSVQEQMQ